MRLLALAIGACIAALFPSAVHAGTASVIAGSIPDYGAVAEATYAANPGEHNDVTLTAETDAVLYEDAGAPVEAGEHCEQVDASTARCSAPGLRAAKVLAGDEDDDVQIVSPIQTFMQLRAEGEGGDDDLTGSDFSDILLGGAGADAVGGGADRDSVYGGAGVDTVSGGEGDDRLSGDGYLGLPAADTLDGGLGSDVVGYNERTSPIDVDLARGTGNGAPGENDALTGIENIEGGHGGGRLAGDAGPNFLQTFAGSGTTRLVGRGGDDRLFGTLGDETLSGGRGADSVHGRGGRDTFRAGPGADEVVVADTGGPDDLPWAEGIHCGSGNDLVSFTRWHDVVGLDCEGVEFSGVSARPRIRRVDGDTLELRLRRLEPQTNASFCRALAVLFAPYPQADETVRRRRIGAVAVPVSVDRDTRARVQLNNFGRKLVARRPKLSVLARVGSDFRCEGPIPYVPDYGFTAALRQPD